jgi:succinate dehydrogenase/fumarate reductase cytochrome b subunit
MLLGQLIFLWFSFAHVAAVYWAPKPELGSAPIRLFEVLKMCPWALVLALIQTVCTGYCGVLALRMALCVVRRCSLTL